MLYIWWIISFIGTVLYALSKKTKKGKWGVLVISFLFMFVTLGWARGSYDIEIGINRYNNYQLFQSFTEIGYDFLVSLGHSIHLDYRQFFLLCALFELFCLFWFVERNCVRSPIVIGLYLVWPMIAVFPLTRSLLAFSFVLIAVDGLLHKSKGYLVKYIVLVLIASTIHFSSVFFLLYLIIDFVTKKQAVIISVIGFILLYLATGISLFSRLISQFVGDKRAEIVLGSITNEGMFGRIFAICLFIFQFFFIYYCLKKIMHIDMTDDASEWYFKINILSIIFIPLVINYGIGFSRFPTLLTIINYCFYVNKISTIKNQKKRLILYALLGSLLLLAMYINIRNLQYRQLVVTPFFEMNELI